MAIRIGRLLGNALEGKPCEVFSSDVRVRVLAAGLATYLDVSVVRGRMEIDPENRSTSTNPIVLVEVLSDSTESYDRSIKLAHYRLSVQGAGRCPALTGPISGRTPCNRRPAPSRQPS